MSNLVNTALMGPEAMTVLRTVEDRLATYVDTMAPGKPINSQDGAFQQRQLWQGVINFLLNQSAPIFLAGWDIFLKVVDENRQGCFSPAYIHRFREETNLGVIDRRNYERLIHLAYVTSSAGARKLSLKQIDMRHVLASLPKEDQRQKLVAFYEI